MKQHIDVKQWESLSDEQQQRLIPWLIGSGGLTGKHYSRYWTVGKSIEFIRNHNQMDIYTVNEYWCVQLFDLNDCANDQKSCVHENDSEELVDAIFECIIWILECLIDA